LRGTLREAESEPRVKYHGARGRHMIK